MEIASSFDGAFSMERDQAALESYNKVMNLLQLQQAIDKLEKDNGWNNSPDEKMTFISEELGEVAKWVRKARKGQLTSEERKELNYEIADVLQHIISLANIFKLDIEEGLVGKKGLSRQQEKMK